MVLYYTTKAESSVSSSRIGEAILLGRETVRRDPWPGTFQDVFTLHAEALELKTKPSIPIGEVAQDAFGGYPSLGERGDVLRALLNVGWEDVDVNGITPLDRCLTVLGASSGYLVVDASRAIGDICVGDELAFS